MKTQPKRTPKGFKIECAISKSIYNLLGVKYQADFIPQNISRNSESEDPSINWRVTISKDKKVISTDYMQGIGHAPFYRHFFGKHLVMDGSTNSRIIHMASKEGKCYKRDPFNRNRFQPPEIKLLIPTLSDVMYSLQIDSDVLNYRSFEEWAPDLGYDIDSRSALKIYKDCEEIAIKLEAMIGRSGFSILQELLEDY